MCAIIEKLRFGSHMQKKEILVPTIYIDSVPLQGNQIPCHTCE